MNTHKSEKFHAKTETEGNVCTVYLIGELDLSVAPDFRLVMEPLVGDTGLDLVINLKDLKYIDSTGIGILLSILKARHGMDVKFTVEEVPPQIQKLFDMTGISKFFAPKRTPTKERIETRMSDDVQKVVLQLPASAEYVDIVRLNLYGIASKMGFTYEDIEDMKVAVSEACNNSVLYAYGQEDGLVDVIFEVGTSALSITVKDEGESFDGVGSPEPRMTLHDKELNDVEVGGLGFYLMQALMDDVSVVSEAGRGTVVTLTKRLNFSEEKV